MPHRYPFLLIDRIIHFNEDKTKIIGYKNITFNEPFFLGTSPNVQLMPGVLICEALAQTGV
jgi:3-hydroxymyristoyl/3-hydroxydecanoyl-(acyl carrier protein) dehydratase